jgi:hypothetical protein
MEWEAEMAAALTFRVLEDLAAFNDAISDRFHFRTIALFCTPHHTAASAFVRREFDLIDNITGSQILAVTLEEPHGGYWRYLQQLVIRGDDDPESVHRLFAKRAIRSKEDLLAGTVNFDEEDTSPSAGYLQELSRKMGLRSMEGSFVMLFTVPDQDRDIWKAQAYAVLNLEDRLFANRESGRALLEAICHAIYATHDVAARQRITNASEWQQIVHSMIERTPVNRQYLVGLVDAPLLSFGHFVALYNARDRKDIKIIMTLHGINTYGKWQKDITPWIGMLGWIHWPLDFGKYPGGFLDAVGFLTGRTPERLLQTFRDTYGNIKVDKDCTDYSDRIAVIAHSFGTKIVADSLSRYGHLMSFERVIFCGSIVDATFDWRAYLGNKRIQGLLNEHGSYDIWTRVYSRLRGQRIAGVAGFQGAPPSVVNRTRKVTHSDWFNRQHFTQVWAPYLKTGVPPPNG